MPQNILLSKFKKFLDISSPNGAKELKKILSDPEFGACFGLTLCHAVMDLVEVNMLAWWEAVLYEITTWDETENSLDKLINLPNGVPLPLRTLLERAINYVILNQEKISGFSIQNFDQRSLLTPNGHFSFLDSKNQIRKIQHREIYAGNFSDQQLSDLLQTEDIKDNIVLLYSEDHIIRVGYKNNQWIVYNANYAHNNPKKIIYKVIDSKEELIKEIRACFVGANKEIAIDICSLKKLVQPFMADTIYQSLLQNNLQGILSGKGWLLIAVFNSSCLLQLIGKNPNLLLNLPKNDINCCFNIPGDTALHVAAKDGNSELVKHLLACPHIEVNLPNNKSRTALHYAAHNGHDQVIKQLIDYRNNQGIQLDINFKAQGGLSALHLAAHYGHLKVAEQLLTQDDIQVNLLANNGLTALHLASEFGHADIVKRLIARDDVDVNIKDKYGDTALITAIYYRYKEVVSLLLTRNDIDVNLPGMNGWSALHMAAYKGDVEIVNQLLNNKNLIIDCFDYQHFTPLHLGSNYISGSKVS